MACKRSAVRSRLAPPISFPPAFPYWHYPSQLSAIALLCWFAFSELRVAPYLADLSSHKGGKFEYVWVHFYVTSTCRGDCATSEAE